MAIKPEILIINDNKLYVESLSALLKAKGYVPFGVYTGQKGLELALNDVFELVLLDVSLPDIASLELIKRIKGLKVSAPIIVIAESDQLEQALLVAKNGAINILIKPISGDLLLQAVDIALKQYHLEQDMQGLRRSLAKQYDILGHAEIIEQFREKLKRIATSSSRVIFFGESGSGKLTAAKFLHFNSERAAGPFYALNCATASSGRADDIHRLECDLFGYEKGVFVGADRSTKGLLELADGGTLYLDEVGYLPPDHQAKLLRAIESSAVERIGSSQEIKVDIRLLAGSTIDLEAEVKAGRFREDLYFRLNVIPVLVPPLRSYPADIPYIARIFLEEAGFLRKWLGREAIEYLKIHNWPGNIRQLKDIVLTAARSVNSDEITLNDIQAAFGGTSIKVPIQTPAIKPSGAVNKPQPLHIADLPYRDHIIDFEKRLLEEILSGCDGNITRAAQILKTDRGNLSKKIKKLGLKASDL